VSGNRILVVARERVQDGRVVEIVAKTFEVKTRFLCDLLDHLGVVDVEPVLMPSAQQVRMEGVETILPAGGLRGLEREPAAHLLGRWRSPGRPALLFRVDLGEREVAPPNVYGSLGAHVREQQ
jgi:hypothetical protein